MKDALTSTPTIILGIIFILAIILVFYWIYFSKGKESFEDGCLKDANYDDPNFANQRFFHYDHIDHLISSDPVHVPKEVLQTALMSNEDVDSYFGNAKKKTQ